jgi:hypothetical protein
MSITLPFLLNLPERTPHGIDGLTFCMKFMEMLDGNGNLHANYDRIKAFIVSQIKRGMTTQEDHDLAQGIVNYVRSTPETNERLEAMDYLFNIKFIQP